MTTLFGRLPPKNGKLIFTRLNRTPYDVPAYCSSASVYLAGNGHVGRNGGIGMGSGGGGTGSVGSASYATIASFQKMPLTPASSVFPTVGSLAWTKRS